MRNKGRIKVIKKGAEAHQPAEPEVPKYEGKRAARDMVATVSDWVKEVQSKKKEQSAVSVDKFFGRVPQASGA